MNTDPFADDITDPFADPTPTVVEHPDPTTTVDRLHTVNADAIQPAVEAWTEARLTALVPADLNPALLPSAELRTLTGNLADLHDWLDAASRAFKAGVRRTDVELADVAAAAQPKRAETVEKDGGTFTLDTADDGPKVQISVPKETWTDTEAILQEIAVQAALDPATGEVDAGRSAAAMTALRTLIDLTGEPRWKITSLQGWAKRAAIDPTHLFGRRAKRLKDGSPARGSVKISR